MLRGLRATNTAIHDQVLQRYEHLGEAYPFDAIALVGCYGDLSPRSADLGAKKVATIAAYNAQGWTYPRLINASHKQFWEAIDSQISERRIQVPVYKGEWGTAWDAWPASMAYYFAAWRRAQERAALADKLAAIVAHARREVGTWPIGSAGRGMDQPDPSRRSRLERRIRGKPGSQYPAARQVVRAGERGV